MKHKESKWSIDSKILTKELHKELTINNRDWHLQKSDSRKRAAELIISALSQLINNGEADDIKDLLNQANKWLLNEIKDPGCPRS